MRYWSLLIMLAFAGAIAASCSSEDGQESPAVCGNGSAFEREGETYCYYSSELIIEGFECPSGVPHAHELGGDVVCSTETMSGADLADFTNDELGHTCCSDACNECVPVAVPSTGSLADDVIGTWFVPPERILEIKEDGTWASRCLKPGVCVASCDEREGTWELQGTQLVLTEGPGSSSHDVLDLSDSTLLVSGYDDLRPWVRVRCQQFSPNPAGSEAADCDDGGDSGLSCRQNNPGSTCISYDELPGEAFDVCGQGRPRLDVNEPAIDFGAVPVGTAATPIQFGISNTGLGPLEVSWQATAPFVADGQISLGPKTGVSHAGAVRFQSSEPGLFKGTLSFISNGGDHSVRLTATAE